MGLSSEKLTQELLTDDQLALIDLLNGRLFLMTTPHAQQIGAPFAWIAFLEPIFAFPKPNTGAFQTGLQRVDLGRFPGTGSVNCGHLTIYYYWNYS